MSKGSLDLGFHVFKDVCPDAVIFEIDNVIFIALYIMPYNSNYKEKEIFSTIGFIVKNFRNRDIYLFGDLNARCGTPILDNCKYNHNPDQVINTHGKKLIKLCDSNNLTIINGLIYGSRRFDTGFTYFRGSLKSQNDWCLTNNVENVESFLILPKLTLSDHTPCAITITCKPSSSLGSIEKISDGMLSYNHFDKSKRVKHPVSIMNINIPMVIKEFNVVATNLNYAIDNDTDINNISERLEGAIYNACYIHKKKLSNHMRIHEDERVHINSSHCHAIAHANYNMFFNKLLHEDAEGSAYIPYLNNWVFYQELAINKEKKEFNLKVNTRWK